MIKKVSAISLAVVVLSLCYAFSMTKRTSTRAQAQGLTIVQDGYSISPLTILNARRTDDGVSIEVENAWLFPIEYFELQIGRQRVWAGRNSLSEYLSKYSKNIEQPALRLASREVRTFQFPAKVQGNNVKLGVVLLSNGQGWMNGWWLRKLDKPNESGVWWKVDTEESEKHRAKQPAKREIARHVGKSFEPTHQGCYSPTGNITNTPCLGGGSDCQIFAMDYAPSSSGVYLRLDLENPCYRPFEIPVCATAEKLLSDGNCP